MTFSKQIAVKFFPFLIILLSGFPALSSTKDAVYGIVTTTSTPLNIRAGMSTNAKIIAKAPKGSQLRILETFGSWYKVELDDGKTGYASKDYIKFTENVVYGIVTTTSTPLNIRAGMSTNAKIIAKAPKGSQVRIIETFGLWYKVELDNGKIGYASKDYIKVIFPDNEWINKLSSDYGISNKEDSSNEVQALIREIHIKAEKGDANAQVILGNSYDVTQNYQEAFQWYLKAAQQGNAIAQNNLGFMYANGHGVTQNYQEAFKWYLKSAQQGLAVAQINLGELYENGYGTRRDLQQAIEWYNKAAQQGDLEAKSRLIRLTTP